MTRRFEAVIERAVAAAEEKGASTRRTHTDGRTVYRAVATTAALDRYGEVVLPKGAIIENFMKNPVLLDSHNYQTNSVGHVVDVQVNRKQVIFDFVFSGTDRGQELEKQFNEGDMRAFSIGFRPKAVIDIWSPWKEMPKDLTEVKVQYPDGSGGTVQLSEYEQIPYRIYNQWELLEISTVAVPANPEALLLRSAEGIIRRVMEEQPVMKTFVQEQLAEKMEPLMKLLADFTEFEDSEIKICGAVPKHSTPVEAGTWSGSSARASLAKWASSDGSGDKDKINWSKYAKGFAWFDSKNAENVGAYKLPHHTIKDGALIAVWNGVTAAMAALLGARGGVDLNDKSAVYSHLAAHYKAYDKEPPKMKTEGEEYSEEELKAIEDEPLVVEKKELELAPPPPDNSAVVEAAAATIEGEERAADAAAQTLAICKQLSSKIDKMMALMQGGDDEQAESFTQVLLSLRTIGDMLEYAGLKRAVKPEEKKAVEKEILGEVPASLVAALERVDRL